MPSQTEYYSSNWKQLEKRREDYRQKLIVKGVVDGGTKMLALMCRKFK